MDNKKLVFFTGVYDTLDIFSYEMIPEFQRLGYEILTIDTTDMKKGLADLGAFIRTPVVAAITFNNLGFNMELTPGRNIWDDLRIPCVNILMDHPFCHKNALDAAPQNAVVLCPDRNHMRYLQRFYPQIPVVGFLPHGGKDDHIVPEPIQDRKLDILYAGGISRIFAERIKPDFSKYLFDAEKIGEDALAHLIEEPDNTTENALEEELKRREILLSDRELCGFFEEMHYVDLLAVSYFREKTIRTLAEKGFSVTLYGTGWEICDWMSQCKSLDFRGRVSSYEIVEKMRDAKIVLNTMTWFKDGTHDRVFNGMLAGAVAVTDTSHYMKESFCGFCTPDGEDERELVFFELDQIDSLPEQIEVLLENPDQMQKIADRGLLRAKEKESWQMRARELDRDLLSV